MIDDRSIPDRRPPRPHFAGALRRPRPSSDSRRPGLRWPYRRRSARAACPRRIDSRTRRDEARPRRLRTPSTGRQLNRSSGISAARSAILQAICCHLSTIKSSVRPSAGYRWACVNLQCVRYTERCGVGGGHDLGKNCCPSRRRSANARTHALASGSGWSVTDIVCNAGPQDRPFEERHKWSSISVVVSGTFHAARRLAKA